MPRTDKDASVELAEHLEPVGTGAGSVVDQATSALTRAIGLSGADPPHAAALSETAEARATVVQIFLIYGSWSLAGSFLLPERLMVSNHAQT